MSTQLDEIPTEDAFLKSGGTPGNYQEFVQQRVAELEEKAKASAVAKAQRTVKIRVKGGPGAWRQGQASTMIPSQAPLRMDPKLGIMVPSKPEPGITVPIGKVVEVPIRDEEHLQCLKDDQNIEVLPEDALTTAEEAALLKEAADKLAAERRVKAGKK